MSRVILYPTETSQWHALVNEAQAYCDCQMHEDVESYLVFLLMRFSNQSELASSVIAMDFLDSIQTNGNLRIELLRDVGDKSLLFSGLFPGIAQKRQISLKYFTDIGQTAYLSIAEIEPNVSAELFIELCNNFLNLKDILASMRNCNQDLFSLENYLELRKGQTVCLSSPPWNDT